MLCKRSNSWRSAPNSLSDSPSHRLQLNVQDRRIFERTHLHQDYWKLDDQRRYLLRPSRAHPRSRLGIRRGVRLGGLGWSDKRRTFSQAVLHPCCMEQTVARATACNYTNWAEPADPVLQHANRSSNRPSSFCWLCEPSSGGDPGMTRTCDLRFRKPSLYPAELRDRGPAEGCGCLGPT
jgi:hypothetical protein